jgi:hypothetical protein
VSDTDAVGVPVGGFAFLAPAGDACEGDACVIPDPPMLRPGAPSLLGSDVGDGRLES